MSIYADTNYFGYLYLSDTDDNEAQTLFEKHRPILPITWLLRLELINAIQQAVFFGFGERQIRISAEHASACQQHVRDDLRDETVMRLTDVSMSEVTRLFEEISLRHTAKHGFRAYDILHVASALALKCRSFWSFDKRANKLAKLEGLKTI